MQLIKALILILLLTEMVMSSKTFTLTGGDITQESQTVLLQEEAQYLITMSELKCKTLAGSKSPKARCGLHGSQRENWHAVSSPFRTILTGAQRAHERARVFDTADQQLLCHRALRRDLRTQSHSIAIWPGALQGKCSRPVRQSLAKMASAIS